MMQGHVAALEWLDPKEWVHEIISLAQQLETHTWRIVEHYIAYHVFIASELIWFFSLYNKP